jgi:amino acid transporter
LSGVVIMAIACAAPSLCICGTLGYVLKRTGASVPLGFFVSTLLILLIAVSYVQISQRHNASGGTYAYIQAVFGDSAGLWTAWIYLGIMASIGSVSAVFANFLHNLVPAIPAWAGVLICVAITLGVGLLGSAFGSKGTTIMWIGQMILMLIPAIMSLVKRHDQIASFGHHFVSMGFTPAHGIAGLTLGVLLCVYSFIGFEVPAYMSNELQGGNRTVKKAIPISVIAIGISFFLLSWLWVGGMSDADVAKVSGSDVAVSDYLHILGGGAGAIGTPLVDLAVMVGALGAVFAWVNSFPQMSLSLSKAGFLPKAFGRQNRLGAPVLGTVLTAVVFLGMAYVGLYYSADLLVSLSVVFMSTAYIFVSVANIKDGWRDKKTASWFFMRLILPALGVVLMGIMLASQGKKLIVILVVWAVLGFAVVLIRRAVLARRGPAERPTAQKCAPVVSD